MIIWQTDKVVYELAWLLLFYTDACNIVLLLFFRQQPDKAGNPCAHERFSLTDLHFTNTYLVTFSYLLLLILCFIKPCPHWRLSPNSATHRKRRLSPNSATNCRQIRRLFSRQCGPGFTEQTPYYHILMCYTVLVRHRLL